MSASGGRAKGVASSEFLITVRPLSCLYTVHRYATVSANITMPVCPKGTQPDTSKLTCETCADGTFSDGGTARCSTCPSLGVLCVGGVLTMQSGWYLHQPDAAAPARITADSAFFKCWNADACLIDNRNRTTACAAGYSGPRCGVCQEDQGYAAQGTACVKCWSDATNWTLVLLTVGLVVGVITYLSVVHKFTHSSRVKIILRILLVRLRRGGSCSAGLSLLPCVLNMPIDHGRVAQNYLQVLASLGRFQARGTALFREVFGFADSVGTSPFGLPFMQCTFHASCVVVPPARARAPQRRRECDSIVVVRPCDATRQVLRQVLPHDGHSGPARVPRHCHQADLHARAHAHWCQADVRSDWHLLPRQGVHVHGRVRGLLVLQPHVHVGTSGACQGIRAHDGECSTPRRSCAPPPSRVRGWYNPTQVMSMLKCERRDIGGVRYLSDDMSVECGGLRYMVGTIVACLGAVVYALGIPIGLYWLLRRNVTKLDDRTFCAKVRGRMVLSWGAQLCWVSHVCAL